jgi:hypothetical protein
MAQFRVDFWKKGAHDHVPHPRRHVLQARAGPPDGSEILALAKLGRQIGFGPMRVMTDVSAERYRMVHDLVREGRREIYSIET